MNRYNHLLFDFDDTLIDYNKSEKFALEKTCQMYNIEYSESLREKYFIINKNLWKNLEKGLIKKNDIPTERFKELFKQNFLDVDYKSFANKYIEAFRETAFLVDHAKEILEYLYPLVKISIITNGMKGFADHRSKLAGIHHFFQDFYVSEDIGYSKPSKKYFDYVLDNGNINANTALIIGDSLTSDMQGGINSNIDTCYFNYRNIPKDNILVTYEIHNLLEIKKIIF